MLDISSDFVQNVIDVVLDTRNVFLKRFSEYVFHTDSHQPLFLNFRLQLRILGILVAAVVDEHRIRDISAKTINNFCCSINKRVTKFCICRLLFQFALKVLYRKDVLTFL